MNTSNNPLLNKLWIASAVILCVGVTISHFQVSAAPQNNDPNAAAQQKDDYYSLGIDYTTEQQQFTLPDWLADFNDPDVGPGVPYTPSNNENLLKILSWDLVPPKENDPQQQTATTNYGTFQQNTFPSTFSMKQTLAINRGVSMASNQPILIKTTTQRPTTTTMMPTTTTTTITTTTTTTTPSPVTTTDAISTSSEISSEIFALPGGNSEFLPSWLEGFDDPELSIAVPFEVPEDNNVYNHTLSNNLLPPLEPFEDLKVLSVPGFPPNKAQPVITTTTAGASITTPLPIRTTTIKTPLSIFKPFQFKFLPKQPINPPVSFTQTPFFTTTEISTIPTTTPHTIIGSPISARIPQFTLKSSAQPTGFKINSFLITQPTVKPTLQTLFDVKANPFLNSRTGQNGLTSFQKLRTTTVPTTSEFLFGSATTPSWLTGMSGVNPSPGVPFSLPENRERELTFNGIVSPISKVAEQTIDGVTIQKSISSEIPPFNFIHNSIPSQSIIPTNQTFVITSTPLPEPSRLFTPPMVVLADNDDNVTDSNLHFQTIPINSYNNIPEATESTTKSTSKVTFNKSNQGKVISNSVFEPVQLSTKPIFGVSQPASSIGNSLFEVSQPASSIGFDSSTRGPSFVSQSSTTGTVFAGKYTGGFKGAPGILGGQNRPGYAIQPDGSIRDPDHTVRPPGQVAAHAINDNIPSLPSVPTPSPGFGQKRDYKGSFGGPPGVLVPYDNQSKA